MWTTKLMIDGVWRGDVVETPEIAAKRADHAGNFSGVVTRCGAGGFPAEPGRYHLYVSHACPFAHRVILAHSLKSLAGVVGVSVLDPRWNTPDGWTFGRSEHSTGDRAGNGFTHLHQAFSASRPDYTGRMTVPLLWDRGTRRIVSDDSRAIMTMLGSAFDAFCPEGSPDLYPVDLRTEIDGLSDEISAEVAIGAYRIGGAPDQAAYDVAEMRFFATLDRLDGRLGDGRSYLHGEHMTTSDILLFTPLLRFEPVYRPLFRALRRSLRDYAALSAWLDLMLASPAVGETVSVRAILVHYYDSWAPRNPGIVPTSPAEPDRWGQGERPAAGADVTCRG